MDQANIYEELNNLLRQEKILELRDRAKTYLETNKADVSTLEFLGLAYFLLKQFKESAEVFNKILLLQPASIFSLLHLARIFHALKDYTASITCYEKIIKLDEKSYDCLIEYAGLLINLKKINRAISILNQAININPNSYQAHSLMGLLFLKSEKFANAITYFNQSLKINPKNFKDLNNVGLCYYKLEKINEAKKFFLNSIKINSHFSNAYSNLGLAYQTEGNFSEAISFYEQSLEINPADCDTYRLLSMTKKIELHSKHTKKMKEIYSSDISMHDKMLLGFALAKVMEDNGNYQEASLYLKSANQIRKDNFSNFDIMQIEKQFDLITKTFTHNFFSRNKTTFNYGVTPIFIVGMPRSGTTLAEQILSNHPSVYGCGEINHLTDSINDIFPQLDSSIMLQEVQKADHVLFQKIGTQYTSKLKSYSKHLYFTDKMPFNFKVIGLIKVSIPGAKIIHCYRNPNDNLLSIYKNYFSKDIMAWAYSTSELKIYYKQYQKLMQHYNETLGDFIYNLDYELLTANPKEEVANMLKYCNLEWNEACLNIQENSKPIFTASISQARSEINTKSHARWKKFEPFLPDLFF